MLDRPALDWIPPGHVAAVHLTDYTGPIANDQNDEQVTGATTKIMSRLIREDSTDPAMLQASADIRRTLPRNPSDLDKDRATFWFVKRHVKFVGDEQAIEPFDFFFPPDELLIRPATLLTMQRPLDDCDGFSMLTACLLRTLGVRSSLCTIAANKANPRRYSHVFVVAHNSDGQDVPLDTSHGPAPGVEHPSFKRRLWPIEQPNMIRPVQQIRRPPPGLRAFDFSSIVKPISDLAAGILIPRYGNPPPGTMRQTAPDGTSLISTYPGGGATLLAGGTSTTTLLLIGGAALLAVVMMSSGRR